MNTRLWIAEKRYDELPLLAPSQELETKSILKACITARAALAALNQAGRLLPSQGLLINLLLVLEAQSSSEIENIVTTTDKLFQYAQEEDNADPMTKEALNYRRALFNGFESLKKLPLSTRTAVDLSRFIVMNKSDYYRLLLAVTTEGDWESWILFMLKAIEETSLWTKNKIAAITDLIEQTTSYVKEHEPKIYSHELIELLFEQPYCRISNLVDKGIAKRQ